MGGPGSGRRPAVKLNNDLAQQRHDSEYKDIIYPIVKVGHNGIGAIINSQQVQGGTAYETYALCELPGNTDDYVNLTLVRYEPCSFGMMGNIKNMFGAVEAVTEESKDGYILAIVRLLDEVKYDEKYEVYSPDKHDLIKPLQSVYTAWCGGRSVFQIREAILNDVNFPIGVTVSPEPPWDKSAVIVRMIGGTPVLLGIWPRWSWQEVLDACSKK